MDKRFGEYIADVRKSKMLTYQEVSDLTGVTCSFLHRIENGQYDRIAINRFLSIVNALELDFLKSIATAAMNLNQIELDILESTHTKVMYKQKELKKEELFKLIEDVSSHIKLGNNSQIWVGHKTRIFSN